MILGLTQWVESTYQGCKDPTLGRDEEETPEVHECLICGNDFESGEGKLLDGEDKWCNKCCHLDKVYSHYREVADLTDRQLYDMKVINL